MNQTNIWGVALAASCLLANAALAEPPTASLAAITAASQRETPALDRLEAALRQRVSIDVENQPLNEVLQKLAEQAKVPIRITRKIADAGVQPDLRVTFSLKDVSLRSGLRNLLERLNLTFILKNEVITVTTREDAGSTGNLVTKIYPVKDLVRLWDNSSLFDFDSLMEAIRANVEPDTWNGSDAFISDHENPAVLVVSHRYDIHERIEALLEALRKAKGSRHLVAEGAFESKARAKIETSLAKPVSYHFNDVPLKDVVARLQADSGIPFVVSRKIEDAGVELHDGITFRGDQVSLRSFLQAMLADRNLTFIINNEVLLVTTVEDAQSPEKMVVCVYPVRDLIEYPPPRVGEPPGHDSDALGQVIMTLEPDCWRVGTQFLTFHDLTGCFVIAQTDAYHEKIVALLAALRKAKALQDSSGNPAK